MLRHIQHLLYNFSRYNVRDNHQRFQSGAILFVLQARPEQLCMCCADPPGSASAWYRLKSSISEAGGLEHWCTEPAVHVHFLWAASGTLLAHFVPCHMLIGSFNAAIMCVAHWRKISEPLYTHVFPKCASQAVSNKSILIWVSFTLYLSPKTLTQACTCSLWDTNMPKCKIYVAFKTLFTPNCMLAAAETALVKAALLW